MSGLVWHPTLQQYTSLPFFFEQESPPEHSVTSWGGEVATSQSVESVMDGSFFSDDSDYVTPHEVCSEFPDPLAPIRNSQTRDLQE